MSQGLTAPLRFTLSGGTRAKERQHKRLLCLDLILLLLGLFPFLLGLFLVLFEFSFLPRLGSLLLHPFPILRGLLLFLLAFDLLQLSLLLALGLSLGLLLLGSLLLLLPLKFPLNFFGFFLGLGLADKTGLLLLTLKSEDLLLVGAHLGNHLVPLDLGRRGGSQKAGVGLVQGREELGHGPVEAPELDPRVTGLLGLGDESLR